MSLKTWTVSRDYDILSWLPKAVSAAPRLERWRKVSNRHQAPPSLCNAKLWAQTWCFVSAVKSMTVASTPYLLWPMTAHVAEMGLLHRIMFTMLTILWGIHSFVSELVKRFNVKSTLFWSIKFCIQSLASMWKSWAQKWVAGSRTGKVDLGYLCPNSLGESVSTRVSETLAQNIN